YVEIGLVVSSRRDIGAWLVAAPTRQLTGGGLDVVDARRLEQPSPESRAMSDSGDGGLKSENSDPPILIFSDEPVRTQEKTVELGIDLGDANLRRPSLGSGVAVRVAARGVRPRRLDQI
ncbi:hypothetical protein AKJ16_DCAP08147, partial [Drosera capensis]